MFKIIYHWQTKCVRDRITNDKCFESSQLETALNLIIAITSIIQVEMNENKLWALNFNLTSWIFLHVNGTSGSTHHPKVIPARFTNLKHAHKIEFLFDVEPRSRKFIIELMSFPLSTRFCVNKTFHPARKHARVICLMSLMTALYEKDIRRIRSWLQCINRQS